jgi:UDP-glucose 4-epimerase
MNQKTVLVTGGAGFIGTHLCQKLLKEGYRVISLDNYFTGSRDNHIEGVEYREGHTKDIAHIVTEKIDHIYHLGEYSRVAKSIDEPGVVWDLNVLGSLAVFEFWRQQQCPLLYAGSSTKFAQSTDGETEGRNLAPYTWAKAVNSELVVNYSQWYGLQYSIVYFYNVYGPGERAGVDAYGTVIETFKQNYLSDKPLQVRMPGTQTRAFTHVEDTVSGIVLAAEKGNNDEYAICAHEVYSLLDIANWFGGAIEMVPQTKSSRSSGTMDVSKLENLGWKQHESLESYIHEIKKQKT